MTDISTISAVLGSIKTALEIANLIKDSDISLEQAEIKLKIADLISSLADAKIELANVNDLLREKDNLIRKLEEQIDIQKSVVWIDPYYSVKTDQGNMEGKYCQQCYDNDKKLIRLQDIGQNFWICNTCQNRVTTDRNDVIPNF